jgi:hypothetical protein
VRRQQPAGVGRAIGRPRHTEDIRQLQHGASVARTGSRQAERLQSAHQGIDRVRRATGLSLAIRRRRIEFNVSFLLRRI